MLGKYEKLKSEKNEEFYQRACKSLAGGLLTNYKAVKGKRPVYVDRVDGAHIYDVDGNKRYDFSLLYGPAILGQSCERLKQDVIKQINERYTNDIGTIQIECAELFQKCVPGLELLRFGLSGSEVNMQAARVARAYTGKSKFIRFAGHYHGSPDFIIGGVARSSDDPSAVDEIRPGDYYSEMTHTAGRAANALSEMYVLEYNDLPALEALLKKDAQNIAFIIFEVVAVNIHGCRPEPGYLEAMRALCDKYNVLMIYDEVITGFRMDIGGAAAVYGVTPDLWTFSKAIGGGFPCGAYGGKKEIMDTITDCEVLAAGSFPGHPVTAAAMKSTLTQLLENDCEILKRIADLGNMLADGFLRVAAKNNVPLIIQGFPAAIVPVFTRKEKIINNADAIANADMKAYWYFSRRMLEMGISNLQRYSCGAAHTKEDVEYAIKIADIVMSEIAEKQALNWE